MSDIILVYTTFEDKEEAIKLSKMLLEKKLIACAQIDATVDSIYWWKGTIEQTQEFRLVMKSNQGLWEELVSVIEQHHSYDIPEIVAVQVASSNRKYQQWVQETVKR